MFVKYHSHHERKIQTEQQQLQHNPFQQPKSFNVPVSAEEKQRMKKLQAALILLHRTEHHQQQKSSVRLSPPTSSKGLNTVAQREQLPSPSYGRSSVKPLATKTLSPDTLQLSPASTSGRECVRHSRSDASYSSSEKQLLQHEIALSKTPVKNEEALSCFDLFNGFLRCFKTTNNQNVFLAVTEQSEDEPPPAPPPAVVVVTPQVEPALPQLPFQDDYDSSSLCFYDNFHHATSTTRAYCPQTSSFAPIEDFLKQEQTRKEAAAIKRECRLSRPALVRSASSSSVATVRASNKSGKAVEDLSSESEDVVPMDLEFEMPVEDKPELSVTSVFDMSSEIEDEDDLSCLFGDEDDESLHYNAVYHHSFNTTEEMSTDEFIDSFQHHTRVSSSPLAVYEDIHEVDEYAKTLCGEKKNTCTTTAHPLTTSLCHDYWSYRVRV